MEPSMEIKIPDSIRKELKEQFYADEHYEGYNNSTLMVEWLKGQLGMEKELLEVR